MREVGIALFLSLAIAVAAGFAFRPLKKFGDSFAVASAIATLTALIVTGFWFVILRPDAPKLKLAVEATPIAVDQDNVLLLVNVELQNVGGSPINFESGGASRPEHPTDGPLKLYVQRVTPLPSAVRRELEDATKAAPKNELKKPYLLVADNWATMASLVTSLSTRIGVGEVENYYFRTMLPCRPGLRMAVQARVRQEPADLPTWISFWRPNDVKKRVWIKQVYVDASEECGGQQ